MDSGDGEVVFEWVRPLSETPATQSYETEGQRRDNQKQLMVTSEENGFQLDFLFAHGEYGRFRLANDNALSPGGRYVAVFQVSGQEMVPAVFDRRSRELIVFDDIVVSDRRPLFQWVGEDVLVVRDDQRIFSDGLAFGGRYDGAKKQSASWNEAWREDKATASELGGGRYDDELRYRSASVLKLVNVSDRRRVVIDGIGIGSSSVSPSGRYIYAPLHSHIAGAQSYVIIDTLRAEISNIPNTRQKRPTRFAWAPSEDILLIQPVREAFNTKHEVFFIDASRKRQIRVDLTSLVPGVQPSEKDNVPKAVWRDDASVLILGLHEGSASVLSMTLDWGKGTGVVDIASIDVAGDPVARSKNGLLFLHQGTLRLLTTDNTVESVSAELGPLSLEGHQQSTERLSYIESLWFAVDLAAAKSIVSFDEYGDIACLFELPSDTVDIHYTSGESIVFSDHSLKRGSHLRWKECCRERDNSDSRVLLSYNQHLKNLPEVTDPIRVEYNSPSGEESYGWLYLPLGAMANSSIAYPLVVIAYGGKEYGAEPPTGALDFSDIAGPVEINPQLFVASGYAVLLPSVPLEPRGIGSDPMSDAFIAIDRALDSAVETGWVDPNRLALTGHSYGGYTALSIAVQSDRFSAIVASASQSNLVSLYGTFMTHWRYEPPFSLPAMGPGGGVPGVGVETGQHRMGGPFWNDYDRYWRNSPISRVEDVTAPVLLIHGDLDFVPMSQAEEMFIAIARQGKDVQFVRYWGEAHAILQPENQRDLWTRVTDFLTESGVTPGPKEVQ